MLPLLLPLALGEISYCNLPPSTIKSMQTFLAKSSATARYLFITVLIGCTNPKEEIVEQQKSLKDSIAKYNRLIDGEKDYLYVKIKANDIVYGVNRSARIDSIVNERLKESAINGRVDSFYNLKVHYRRVYDSLEFELKKY